MAVEHSAVDIRGMFIWAAFILCIGWLWQWLLLDLWSMDANFYYTSNPGLQHADMDTSGYLQYR